MAGGQEEGLRRSKNGREWAIGGEAEVAWIEERTLGGLAITSAIPPVFAAYATLELPGTGNQEVTSCIDELKDRHDAVVLAILRERAAPQPWWLGYLESGVSDVVFYDAPKVKMYAAWPYVLVAAGPEQAGTWREPGWKGALPDLMFPADRSWLVSTLWDDEWTCIGGSRELVDAFLTHPDLRNRTREVDPSMEDSTPPGHTAF